MNLSVPIFRIPEKKNGSLGSWEGDHKTLVWRLVWTWHSTESLPLCFWGTISSPVRRGGWLECSRRLPPSCASVFHSGWAFKRRLLPWLRCLVNLEACPYLVELSGLLPWSGSSSSSLSWAMAEPLTGPLPTGFSPAHLPKISLCLHTPLLKNFPRLPVRFESQLRWIVMMLSLREPARCGPLARVMLPPHPSPLLIWALPGERPNKT